MLLILSHSHMIASARNANLSSIYYVTLKNLQVIRLYLPKRTIPVKVERIGCSGFLTNMAEKIVGMKTTNFGTFILRKHRFNVFYFILPKKAAPMFVKTPSAPTTNLLVDPSRLTAVPKKLLLEEIGYENF